MTGPTGGGPYFPGPFDMAHLLMQWGGKLPGGEQWSCSMRLGPKSTLLPGTNLPDQGDVASWLAGSMKDAVLAYHQRAGTFISTAAKLSFVKLNAIGVDGHYLNDFTNEYVFADLGGGGPATGPLPNQCALVVSLTTGFTRGTAHRGRFYLPIPAVQVDATGKIVAGVTSSIATSTKTFLEAIADVPGIDTSGSVTPMVMSRKLGAPAHRVITGCEIGAVVDTQRRRRRSLAEGYTHVDLDLGAA